MKTIPKEWIDRLFLRLSEIYGQRWLDYLEDEYHSARIFTLWSNALVGLTPSEMKYAIEACRDNPLASIPTPIEFYYIGKKKLYPVKIKTIEKNAVNTAIAHGALSAMKDNLKGRVRNENNIYA